MGGDFFRDPPGRYLGYCHAVGRAMPSEFVSPMAKTYLSGATFGYIIFDTIYKTIDRRRTNPVLKAADALIWQAIASLIIPSVVVEGVSRGSYMLMDSMKVSKPMNRYIPMALVLISMPLFGDAIDRGVNYVLDNTTRPLFKL